MNLASIVKLAGQVVKKTILAQVHATRWTTRQHVQAVVQQLGCLALLVGSLGLCRHNAYNICSRHILSAALRRPPCPLLCCRKDWLGAGSGQHIRVLNQELFNYVLGWERQS